MLSSFQVTAPGFGVIALSKHCTFKSGYVLCNGIQHEHADMLFTQSRQPHAAKKSSEHKLQHQEHPHIHSQQLAEVQTSAVRAATVMVGNATHGIRW